MIKVNKDYKDVVVINSRTELQNLIKSIDYENDVLDLSNVHLGNQMTGLDFQLMSNKAKIIDVTGWNVGHITTMEFLFARCENLVQIIGLDDWDVSNVLNMKCMFWQCPKLEDIGNISNWKVNPKVNTNKMFDETPKIKISEI